MTTKTETHGTLASSPLTSLLKDLADQQATGVLALDDGGEVWMSEGQTYLVVSPSSPPLLSVLFAAEVGSIQEIQSLFDSGGPVLEQLTSSYPNAISVLKRLVHEYNLNSLFEMMVPSDQSYKFSHDNTHPLGSLFEETTTDLVTKALSRLEIWRKIATRIPSTSAIFVLTHTLPGRAEERLMTADEWRYISYLNGSNTIEDVITNTGESAFRVTSALYRLLLEGLLAEKT